MPFIRYSRDKRGYESTLVMHAYRAGYGSRPRVLYFFRTPSNVKVGRRALDPEVREALEHTHPDLSFDWGGLGKEPIPSTFEPRLGPDRPPRRMEPSVVAPPPEVVPTIVEDDSVLGRTLGAHEALRLRGRYNEILQRIRRRARTPEDRDRLTERASRLNPDDWADATAVRTAMTAVETEWDAIVNELPLRRRGRRGGRFRNGGPGDARSGEGRTHEHHQEQGHAIREESMAGEDRGVDDDRHGGRFGTDATAAAAEFAVDGPTSPDPTNPAGSTDAPVGGGLPGGS